MDGKDGLMSFKNLEMWMEESTSLIQLRQYDCLPLLQLHIYVLINLFLGLRLHSTKTWKNGVPSGSHGQRQVSSQGGVDLFAIRSG